MKLPSHMRNDFDSSSFPTILCCRCAVGRRGDIKPTNAECNLSESVISHELTLGVSVATKFTADGSGFRNWEGEGEGRCNNTSRGESGNHLAVLIPCSAYTTSASTSTPAPTDKRADSKGVDYRVYVGDAKAKEARWWRAVPAPGQGW
ncbi:MAG: hypothetical protein M1825_006258 [Sarcosagium campestre]|nr:MAG: hypothetical protein M1825_006258 [Sarcosagium campestre]